MNMAFKLLRRLSIGSAAAAMAAGIAWAQDSPPPPPAAAPAPSEAAPATHVPKTPSKANAQIDAGEPRANTSPSAPATPAPDAQAPDAHPPGAPAPRAARTGPSARAGTPGPKAQGTDRLDLNTATVTGEREQPKVMYIVPWKKSDIGDLSGKPMNSLLDEALAPVDRDEFKREVAYFDAVGADGSHNGAPNPAKQGEK
ncbi:MAG: hypothetical protein JWN43_3823 [Gammaproteobacteria bacterium]|nr:hypothetical protein [Gammaproteobacteria bacterium]